MSSQQVPRLIDGVCVCSICCHVVWESVFDCDSMVWSDPVDISETLVAGESPGPCPDDIPWYKPGSDDCVRHWDAYYPIADLCGDCDDADKVPPPKPVGEPPGCCGECCKTVWESTFDCVTCTWSSPAIFSEEIDAPCSSDSGWVDDGLADCKSYYTKYTTPADCSEDSPPTPHPAGAPAGCAAEGQWVFTATWNCDTSMWEVGAPDKTCCFSDCSETDWTPSGSCTATRVMCTTCADCRDDVAPDPGVPSYDPSAECCTTCCQTVWESIWDCGEGAWGTPFLYRPRVAFAGPCPPDTDWHFNCIDICAAFIEIYHTASSPEACTSLPPPPPPSPPPGPFLPEPDKCCIRCDAYEGFTSFTCGEEPGTGTWDEVIYVLAATDVDCHCDDFSESCCNRLYEAYVPTGGPPPPNFTPTGDPLDGCCDCVDCGIDQPNASISGFTATPETCTPENIATCIDACEFDCHSTCDDECGGDPTCLADCYATCDERCPIVCSCCLGDGPAIFESQGDCCWSWTFGSGDNTGSFQICLAGLCDGFNGRNTWRLTIFWDSGCSYDSGNVEDLAFCQYDGTPGSGILVGSYFIPGFADFGPSCICVPSDGLTITLDA